MQKKYLGSFLILLAFSASLILSCNKEIEDYIPKELVNPNDASLRVVNTATLPNKIHFYLNNVKYSGDTLAFPGTFPTSEFLRVPSGASTFRANVPVTSTDVLSANLTLGAGTFNTLFLIDTLPALDYYLVTDNQLVPPADSGKTAIRFVHVAKGVGPLNVANATVATAVDTLFRNVTYKSHTDFKVVNSGATQVFRVYNTGTSTQVYNSLTLSLTANRMYTLYIRGRSTGYGTHIPTLTSLVTR